MNIIIILFWIILSFIIASFGGNRKIGYIETLLLSLFFSPLIGAICVGLSEKRQNKYQQNELLINQLYKIEELKKSNSITDITYNKIKSDCLVNLKKINEIDEKKINIYENNNDLFLEYKNKYLRK